MGPADTAVKDKQMILAGKDLKCLRIMCAAIAAFALLGFSGCSRSSEKNKEESSREMLPNEGDSVKTFKLKTLAGRDLDIGSLKGRPLVINFFASWCGPCRREAPYFEKLYIVFKDRGVEFIGVDVQDSAEGVKKFVDEFKISYPVGMDDSGDISRQYMIYALPKTFVVGRDGRFTLVHSGAISEKELADEIKRVL